MGRTRGARQSGFGWFGRVGSKRRAYLRVCARTHARTIVSLALLRAPDGGPGGLLACLAPWAGAPGPRRCARGPPCSLFGRFGGPAGRPAPSARGAAGRLLRRPPARPQDCWGGAAARRGAPAYLYVCVQAPLQGSGCSERESERADGTAAVGPRGRSARHILHLPERARGRAWLHVAQHSMSCHEDVRGSNHDEPCICPLPLFQVHRLYAKTTGKW